MGIDLSVGSREMETVFNLLGEDENAMTATLGWALKKSESLLAQLISFSFPEEDFDPLWENIIIRLQRYESNKGYTDIEVYSQGKFHIIIEAKRGWNLPNKSQLLKYASRPGFNESRGKKKILVLSGCRDEYARNYLPTLEVEGTDIKPISWKQIIEFGEKLENKVGNIEKRNLRDLMKYLRGVLTMRNIESNMVFVVPISTGKPNNSDISWIEVVEEKNKYFHPIGNRYPKEPVTYLGFRYHGKLQSIHWVEDFEVTRNLNNQIPEMPSKEKNPEYVYSLGPSIGPHEEVRSGKIYGPSRHWCMLDTLLTCETVKEAHKETNKRLEEAGRD